VIFGAAALGAVSPDQAAAVLQTASSAGVNHIDTAASYGDSELRLQPWLAEHRHSVFLATKTDDRDGSGARAGLERSLERMGVDQVDLIQLHNLVEEDEWRAAFAPGGAVEALADARDEGLCRFIGVTGHGTRIPAIHLRSLDAFPFDSVLFPYNYALLRSARYRAEVEALIDECQRRDVAIQTIKAIARRRWPNRSGQEHSWYEPLQEVEPIERAVHYVLGRPGLFLVASSDARLLPAILAAAITVDRPPPAELMEADRLALGIAPLFDGAELEHI
jgi:aryl-alcohol dehydrogenase-like predicted oxidoreductase